ncbi:MULTISPECIES: hypothetical protein [unclassified Bartonella]|uniref:hypothetical protein n=1 Tax=unclassified Bartonella TaxID=2645622 RepID=UPI0021CA21A3|nr:MULTISPECIES: hypothetical protein [unclassified Bartonella]UXN02633.1 hypothetical protein N6B01_09120 [Bartonella sp. HY406]UXN05595.1 hypothetical protein N6A79_09845 [Bartonella sp. HY761]
MNDNKLKKEDYCDAVFKLLILNGKFIIFALIFIATAGFALLSGWVWEYFCPLNPTNFDMLHLERNTLWYKYIEFIFDAKTLYINICIAGSAYWWIILFKLCNLKKSISFLKEKQDFISPIMGYFYAVVFITITFSFFSGDKAKLNAYLLFIPFSVILFNLIIYIILLSLTDRDIRMSACCRFFGISISFILFLLLIGFTLKSGFQI